MTSLRLLARLTRSSSTRPRAKRLAPCVDGPLAHFRLTAWWQRQARPPGRAPYLRHRPISVGVIVLQSSIFNTFVRIDYDGKAGENITNDTTSQGDLADFGAAFPFRHSLGAEHREASGTFPLVGQGPRIDSDDVYAPPRWRR